MKGRRSSIDIVYDILRLLRLGEAGKTEVMYSANLSYFQVQEYLDWLLKLGLIDKLKDEFQRVRYRIEKKGLKLISNIEDTREMLDIGTSDLLEFTIRERLSDKSSKLQQ